MSTSPNFTMVLTCMLVLSTFAAKAQNNSFMVGIHIGAGSSSFLTGDTAGEGTLSSIQYPVAGLSVQKRLNPRWALNFFSNVGMSGAILNLNEPLGQVTRLKSKSAFANLAIHGKYALSKKFYCSAGPELSYMLWNRGSTYVGEELRTRRDEIDQFKRINLLASASVGYITKVQDSRKNAPVQISLFWFIELRGKAGLTNMLADDLSQSFSSKLTALELSTGFYLSSQH